MASVIVTWDLSGATGTNSTVYTQPKAAISGNPATWNTRPTSAVHGEGETQDLLNGIQAIVAEFERQLRAPQNANVRLRLLTATLMDLESAPDQVTSDGQP